MRNLDCLYRHRFSEGARLAKDAVWQVLCRDFFQDFVRESDTILDIGCGQGEFSRHIKAGRKYAVDLNPESADCLDPGIVFFHSDARQLAALPNDHVDVAFASNFFEHLPHKGVMDEVLAEVLRVLRPGGRFLVLQPNIRLIPATYWDFYDHFIPLSDRSFAEAFVKAGYEVELLIPRFLPYTTRSVLPSHPALVRMYLRFKPIWAILGKQLFIVGRKHAIQPASS